MDDELKARIDAIAGKLVQEVMLTGLMWDEAAAALGLAAKATAQAAASAGHAPASERLALAHRCFKDAFAQGAMSSSRTAVRREARR